MFCRHNWKEVVKTITESKVEHIVNIGCDIKEGVKDHMLSRVSIIIIQCSKCGKLDKTITKI